MQASAVARVIHAMEGWAKVADNVWIISTDQAVSDVRDAIRATVPDGNVLVAKLAGAWGASGIPHTSEHLRSVRGWF